MKRLLLATAVTVFAAGFATAHADELDNDSEVANAARMIQDLPQTVVVRENVQTHQVEVLESKTKLPGDETAKNQIALNSASFKKVDANGKVASELDQVGSVSSWCFYFNWGYPYYAYNPYFSYDPYAYYGYGYAPYYGYSWGGYNYNFYGYGGHYWHHHRR
jgi:hypothetical protein